MSDVLRFKRSAGRGAGSGQRSRLNSNRVFLLRAMWKQEGIGQGYQGIFEQYLSFLPQKTLEEEIQEEIKQIQGRKSFVFTIKDLSYNRAIALQQLSQQLASFQSSKTRTEKDIESICTSIHNLREANLLYAETLLALHHYYLAKITTFHNYQQLAPFFIALNQDNELLKRSLLRKYIVFSSSYDPFLLKHYQLLKKTGNARLKELPAIQSLFTIPLNQVYRLTKTHEEIRQYLKHAPFERDLRLTVNRAQGLSDFGRRRAQFPSDLGRQSIANDVYLRHSSHRSGSQSPPFDQKNGITKETNFSNYHSDKREIDRQRRIFPRIRAIGMLDQDQISIIKSNRQYGQQNSRNSIGSPEGRKRYFDNKVSQVQQRNAEFKKYVFPKRFEHGSSQISRTQNSLSPIAQSAKESPKRISDVYLTQRNSVQAKKSRNMEVQCDGLDWIEAKAIQKKAEKRKKKWSQEFSEESQAQQSKSKTTPVKKVLHQSKAQQQTQRIEVVFEKPEQPEQVAKKQPKKVQKMQPKHSQKKTKKPVQKQQGGQEKKYRLKASDKNDTIEDIFKTLQRLQINPAYRSNFEVGNWQKSIMHNQYYFHKSYIDDELQAVSLCCALPEGDITIKYWGPLLSCDPEMSSFLFSKYLQHLEKSTLLKSIYFNANFIKELTPNNFIQKKERIYERTRVSSEKIQESEYTYFLAVSFSNLAVSKSSSAKQDLVVQNGLKPFQPQKFIIFNYLLIMSKLLYPGSFSAVASYHSKLKSMRDAHEAIVSKYLSPQAYDPRFRCDNINLLTLKIRNPIFSAFFLADKGYIKVVGELIESTPDITIICLPLLKHSARLYFAQGVKSAAEMLEKVRKGPKNNYERVQFSVRMFRKRLRGHIISINLKEEDCFGDLEVSFVWKDYLKGKIVHPMTDCEEVFDKGFYCLFEMEKETMLVFEVLPEQFVTQ